MRSEVTIFRNGMLLAADENRAATRPTAMAVQDGRIAWIGTEDDASAAPAGSTVDLQHALVTPAFVDAHIHCTSTGLALTGLDLRRAASLEEALQAIASAARTARGRPLLGSGWDQTDWPEGRPPTAAELDRASWGSAVYLSRVDKHSAVVSSALMSGIPHLPDTAGFDPAGWQRGPAHDAVRLAAYAALSPAQRTAAQRAALQQAASVGIACVHEMAGPVISSADDLLGLLALAESEALPDVVPYWAELLGIETARELGAIGAAGDLFCDGSLGSHTAALGEPYADLPGRTGSLRHTTGDIAEHMRRCVDAGLQFGFHAIGDAAVDQVLDAVEKVGAQLGRPIGSGHRIEHAEFVRDPRRLAASGLTASMQPMFDALWGGPNGMYAQRLGPDRARQLNRFADLAAAGVPLAFGSDAPVTELGPWAAVRAAVSPTDPSAGLPVQLAFAAHTAGAQRAAGQGSAGGQLVTGSPATFAVWALPELDRGIDDRSAVWSALAAGAVPECLTTVRGGVPLYESAAWSAAIGPHVG